MVATSVGFRRCARGWFDGKLIKAPLEYSQGRAPKDDDEGEFLGSVVVDGLCALFA